MSTTAIDKKNTKITAHRGLSGLETENTASAFIAAGNRSYFGIETDIRKTADGVYVCNHDGNLERIAGVKMVVEKSSYDELAAIEFFDRVDGRAKNYLRIATLSDYVRICKKYGKVCVCELKSDFSTEELAEIVAEYETQDYLGSVIFISFGFEVLVRLRRLLPDVSIQYLTGGFDDSLIAKLKENRFDIDIHHEFLTAENVKTLHDNGIIVNCWTVDNKERADELVSFGVDHITTNILE